MVDFLWLGAEFDVKVRLGETTICRERFQTSFASLQETFLEELWKALSTLQLIPLPLRVAQKAEALKIESVIITD